MFLLVAALCAAASFENTSNNIYKPNMDTSLQLLESVYGPINDTNNNCDDGEHGLLFPRPLPEDEAGLCLDGKQRRYLWTDAFGVLAYISISNEYESESNAVEAERYKRAANTLIDTVHKCLGVPRSNRRSDAMTSDKDSPTGYIGLRIGKVKSRTITDAGMEYDGQYWHYIDKWLLALQRAGRIDDGIRIAKSCFPRFFDCGTSGDGVGGGIRWKVSVDATAPPVLQRAQVSEDTLAAYIVFSLLETSRLNKDSDSCSSSSGGGSGTPSLEPELELLRMALAGYKPRTKDTDPLGWGLVAIFDQFLMGNPRTEMLNSVHRIVLRRSHMTLPFRLYGALIGARVVGDRIAPMDLVDQLVTLAVNYEDDAIASGCREPHSSINRVMLAMCMMCPGALGRLPSDPLLTL